MKNNNLFTLFIIVFLDLLGVGIMIPVLAPLFFGTDSSLIPAAWTETQRSLSFGVLVSIYPFAQFIGAPILGGLSDRFGRKKILIISVIGTMIGYLLFGVGLLTHNLWLLFFSRALDGFTGGNVGVANSAIADMSKPENRAKNFGLVGMAFGFGFVIGPFLGGMLSDPGILPWFSEATPFWFASLLAALNLILLTFLFEETLKKSAFRKIVLWMGFQDIGKAFRMHNLRTIFTVIFLHTIGFAFFTQFFPVFLVQKFQMDSGQIGFFFAYVGVWIALSQGLFTRLVARFWIPEKVLKVAFFALALSLVITTLPNVVWILFLTQPALAFFEGLAFPNSTAVVSHLSSESEQGEAMGIAQSLRALAQAIPPLVASVLLTFNQNLAIWTGAGIILLAGLIFVIFFRSKALTQTS